MTKKITPLQYAIFLYEITRKPSETKKMTKDFLEILAKNNDLAKIDEIVNEFEKYEKKQMGITEVELISAKPIAKETKSQILKAIGTPARGGFALGGENKKKGENQLKKRVPVTLLDILISRQ